MKIYKNYEEIDVYELMKGESVFCRMTGTQGIDGNEFEISLPNADGYVLITRIK